MSLSKVWVYAESAEGKPTSLTLELLTKARELGDTVEAFYAGADAAAVAPVLGSYGAAKVHSVAERNGALPGPTGRGCDGRAGRSAVTRPRDVRDDL